ncbi:NAD(P)-dependent oxidoreductase [Acinetobacter sp.]|uniref:NAD(P)-dependent oxidoreductase n=1 Tax=Acinetobacter sp. TaxID=472 RepID=UPI00389094CD
MKIGFIGLGRMGFPLASHLVKNGLDVTAFDLNLAQIEKFIQLGGKSAENIQHIAKNADIVFTMLPGPKQSKEVILGDNGVLANLSEGKYLIELSTIDTDTVDLLYQHAKEKNIKFADAPVGRLAAHADLGESLFMLGAETAEFDYLQDLLLKMGTTVLHCGEPGAGTRMKLINNLMVLCYCQLNSEALVLAQGLGLDAKKTFEVLTGTTASNGQLKEKWPQKVLNNDLTPGFDIALGFKDLTLACQAAQSTGISLPVGNLVRNMFQLARHAGKDGQDTSSMTDFWAEVNQIEKIRI